MPEITSLNDFFIKHPMYHRSLAELMGVSTSIVDKWSNGDRKVNQRTLNELYQFSMKLHLIKQRQYSAIHKEKRSLQ